MIMFPLTRVSFLLFPILATDYCVLQTAVAMIDGMGRLTETEIFDCLKTNLRLAAQSCDKLAVSPRKGPTYVKLRDELRLVEGACGQAAFWRGGDARWLKIGLFMAEAHKRAGGWLRGEKQPAGPSIKLAPAEMHPLFKKLAENLRAAYVKAE